MISAGRWLAALLHGDPADPRICDGCGRTWTRLTPGQHTQIGAKRLPTCRRRSCTGRLWPVRTGTPTPLEDRLRAVLRDRLTDAEKELLGRDAMARVEALKNRAGAPDGPGTPAKPNDCLESKDMSIIHHEDASVYGKGVIHHPLSGRPEYKGLVTTADGPMVRIQDGDLVLHIDDVDTLTRWRRAFELAEAQLTLAAERKGGAR